MEALRLPVAAAAHSCCAALLDLQDGDGGVASLQLGSHNIGPGPTVSMEQGYWSLHEFEDVKIELTCKAGAFLSIANNNLVKGC